MGFNILGKITGIEAKVKWSKAKKIEVVEPLMYGKHFIYIDRNFKVAVFLPKADKTIHVLVGNIFNADRWIKYDDKCKVLLERDIGKKSHQWKINPKNIYYRGSMLSPDRSVYSGHVQKSEEFLELIDNVWIKKNTEYLIKQMKETSDIVF